MYYSSVLFVLETMLKISIEISFYVYTANLYPTDNLRFYSSGLIYSISHSLNRIYLNILLHNALHCSLVKHSVSFLC